MYLGFLHDGSLRSPCLTEILCKRNTTPSPTPSGVRHTETQAWRGSPHDPTPPAHAPRHAHTRAAGLRLPRASPHPISPHHIYIRPRPPHRPQGMSPRVHWSPSGHTYTHARGSPWLSPFPSQPHPASPSCINHMICSTAVALLITTQLHGTRSTLMAGAWNLSSLTFTQSCAPTLAAASRTARCRCTEGC
jgi:hypothetical protein